MEEWIDKRRDDWNKIYHTQEKNTQLLWKILGLVKDFLVDRKVIIFGGMAIDYLLDQKGCPIYTKDQQPDYDALTPNHTQIAYELANYLIANGYPDTVVIRALHFQTMRVRCQHYWVADIGHLPQYVYDIMYKSSVVDQFSHLRFVGPSECKAQIHLSLSFPLKDPPQETINFRWIKDSQRFELLNKHYPVKEKSMNPKFTRCKFDISDLSPFVLYGISAFAFYSPELHCQLNNQMLEIDLLEDFPFLQIIRFEPLSGTPTRQFTSFVELIPEKYCYTNILVYIISSNLLAVHTEKNLNVCNWNLVLIYCWYFSEDVRYMIKIDPELNKWLYQSLLKYSENFPLMTGIMGKKNESISFKVKIMNTKGQKDLFGELPKNFYPKPNVDPPLFQYNNMLFYMDGRPIEELPDF